MKTITSAAVLFSAGVLLSGCATADYRTAQGGAPSLLPVNLATVQPPAVVVLDTIITCDALGSWKHKALWDEYVVTLSNHGTQPLIVSAAALIDDAGSSHACGAAMAGLEKQSLALEQGYHDTGVAFVRNAGPAPATGGGVRLLGATAGGAMEAGARMAVVAAVVPVPAYYARRIVSLDNASLAEEFKQCRLALPLALAPGEARVGSLFFPMVPSPRGLSLAWSAGTSAGDLSLPLESVRGVHVREPAPR